MASGDADRFEQDSDCNLSETNPGVKWEQGIQDGSEKKKSDPVCVFLCHLNSSLYCNLSNFKLFF